MANNKATGPDDILAELVERVLLQLVSINSSSFPYTTLLLYASQTQYFISNLYRLYFRGISAYFIIMQ